MTPPTTTPLRPYVAWNPVNAPKPPEPYRFIMEREADREYHNRSAVWCRSRGQWVIAEGYWFWSNKESLATLDPLPPGYVMLPDGLPGGSGSRVAKELVYWGEGYSDLQRCGEFYHTKRFASFWEETEICHGVPILYYLEAVPISREELRPCGVQFLSAVCNRPLGHSGDHFVEGGDDEAPASEPNVLPPLVWPTGEEIRKELAERKRYLDSLEKEPDYNSRAYKKSVFDAAWDGEIAECQTPNSEWQPANLQQLLFAFSKGWKTRIKPKPPEPEWMPLEAKDIPMPAIISHDGGKSWSLVTSITARGIHFCQTHRTYLELAEDEMLRIRGVMPGSIWKECRKRRVG